MTTSWTSADATTLHAYMTAIPEIGDSAVLAFYLQSEGIKP